MILPAKDPAEIITIPFDFSSEIGELAIVGQAVTITVETGADPDVASMLNGAATIAASDVLQSVKLGVNGVNYALRCLATLSDGQKLVRAATLPVRVAG
jgi:hypothetical protein